MQDAFDENALMDRVDGDVEFLEETISMLDEDSPALLEQIRTAAASRDAENLVQAAHALKGMLANFCAEPAEAACRGIFRFAVARRRRRRQRLLPTPLESPTWHLRATLCVLSSRSRSRHQR